MPEGAPRTVLLVGLLFAGSACGAPAPLAPADKSVRALPHADRGSFVQVDGARFVVEGRPVRVVGVNASVVHGGQTRQEMPRLFEAMNNDHVQVARVWALGEADGSRPWHSEVAFRIGPDEWVEESFAHLDSLLVEARRRNVRVILVLANRWADRGGLPQYARWAGIEPRGRNLSPAELAAVLANERAQTLYLAHLERIVGRTNAITGKRYRDDPTIFAWELINELSASTCAAQESVLAWVERMAHRVHEIDPNHPVAAGHIGYNSEQSLGFWEAVHRLDGIDYADTHCYPQNLLDATSPDRAADWLDHRAARAQALGVPLLVGEVGIPRGSPFFRSREEWLAPFFARAAENGTDGVLVWMYRPWHAGREDPHGIWPWGPFAEETAPVRALLSAQAKSAARARAAEPASAPTSSWPLGVERIAPFVTGTLEGDVLRVDPWALAEGCTAGEGAWLQYALAWGELAGVASVGFEPPAEGTIRVELHGRSVGVLRDGTYEALETGGHAGPVAWLRLLAEDAAGARSLSRFTRALPGDVTLEVRREEHSRQDSNL